MSFAAVENPRTGEYGVLRRPAGTTGGATVADLYARPGAVVAYEHLHPAMTETFTVVRGHLGVRLDGRDREAGPGTRITVPPGTPHAWWNAGPETAWGILARLPDGTAAEPPPAVRPGGPGSSGGGRAAEDEGAGLGQADRERAEQDRVRAQRGDLDAGRA
jgi:quercetin dioxygenase-like cupin family protein